MCHTSECSCGHPTPHAPQSVGHHSWGCCCTPSHPLRRFPAKEEVVVQLEEYLKNLQAEAKGVEEHIAELRKGEA